MKVVIRHLREWAKKLVWPIRHRFYLIDYIFPQLEALRSDEVQNVRVLVPAQRVEIASPKEDAFVPVGKYFREGYFDRRDIYVCEIPEARLYVETGMVCTRNWKIAADIETRLPHFKQYRARRPREVKRLSGTYATAAYCVAWNYYHWMVDCLPRVISLSRAEPKAKVTLIMPDSIGQVQRVSLNAILPANFEIQYYPDYSWLQLERFLWPSLVSAQGNAFLPADYYEAIRRPIFERFDLPPVHAQKERLYVTRRGGRCRRICNEEALMAFLKPYGFQMVDLNELSFREQVELFHRADIVVGPHGAGFNLLFFCGKVHVVVLHPNQVPQNHFHTMAKGLGHHYHFVLHHGGEEDNFDADIPALKRVFEKELGLQPL